MGTKVLVTGSSDGIGRYVVEALTDRGERVIGYDQTRLGNAEERPDVAPGGLFDLPRLLHVMRDHGVQRIVHARDTAEPLVSIEMPVATVVANVESTLHVLEAARLARLQGRIVLLSSSSVYGNNEGPIDESSPLRPRTPYAVTKVAGEHLGAIYADLYGLDVVALRVGEKYGPQLALPPTLSALMRAAIDGDTFQSPTGGDHAFHLTHGEDVCRAVLAALVAEKPNQRIYNITGGERHSLGEIASLIQERFPQSRLKLGSGHLPDLDRQGHLDIRAADRELAYRPLWGLARGIDDYAEWLLAQREAA